MENMIVHFRDGTLHLEFLIGCWSILSSRILSEDVQNRGV